MLQSLAINGVTIRKAATANVKGQRTYTYTDTATTAVVQPTSAERTPDYLRDTAEAMYTVYFWEDPNGLVAGGIASDDLIVWHVDEADSSKDITLAVLAPPINQAGRNACWATYCRVME